MQTHTDKNQEKQSQSVANAVSQKQSSRESTFQFVDNRPEAVSQRKLQEMVNNSPQALQLKDIQNIANNRQRTNQPDQLQSMTDNRTTGQQTIQKKEEENSKNAQGTEVIQLVDMQTEDGTWSFSSYEIQNNNRWRGLADHTLSYAPNGGTQNTNISLIQAVSSNIDGEIVHANYVHQNRTDGTYGFRIDNHTDSNNPIFGARSGDDLTNTAFEGDEYNLGGERNRGTRRRPNIVNQDASRRDNPGFGITDLIQQNLSSVAMGQTFITAAYNMATEAYLGSIAYGWIQEENGEPQLIEMSYTTGGVGGAFIAAANQWNDQRTNGRNNLLLPTPEAVDVRNFGQEEDETGMNMENVGEEADDSGLSFKQLLARLGDGPELDNYMQSMYGPF